MRRYLLTALVIGSAVTTVVLILHFAGAFTAIVTWLGNVYSARGFFGGENLTRIKWLEIPVIAAGALWVAWSVIDVSRPGQKITVALSIATVVLGLSPTLAFYGYLFDPFSSLAAVVLSTVASLAYAGTEKGMRKRVLEDVLGTRVSGRTFHALLEAPDQPDFQGATREATILTCRLLNNAELQESLAPSELMKMSNLFIRSASTFLMSRGAYLDESNPELVRVSFGVLRPIDDHALQACRAALELRIRMRSLSQECETRWFQRLRYGVGISSGRMTVGVYGSPEHFFFSGIGSNIDYSRRIAQANLRYGSDLLIAPETYRIVHEAFEVRPMEMFYDPAANLMTEIYQLLARKDNFSENDRMRRDLFWQGMIYFREKNYEAALDHFSRSRVPGAEDEPVAYYIGKSQEGVAAPETPVSRLTRELTDGGHGRLISMM